MGRRYILKEQLKTVYKIHCIDKRAAALKAQLAEITASDEFKRKMESADRAVASTTADLIKKDADIKDAELRLKSLETKQADYEKRYYDGSVKNPKELTAIEKEIQLLKQQRSKIDGELLALYETATTLRDKLAKASNASQVWRQRYDVAYKKEGSARHKLEKELASLMTARKSSVVKVTNRELITRYEAISKRVGDTGAALVVDNRCEACHVAVTHYITRALESFTTYETCESCGRILLSSKECSE
jgi:predicted  nucleic acid-binding Zn-ribbon protein